MSFAGKLGLGLLSLIILAARPSLASELRANQFIGFTNFSTFDETQGSGTNETVLTSPELAAGLKWDELVVSWNAAMPEGSYLKVEARGLFPEKPTKYYIMGLWSADPERHPRESVPHQKDEQGDVSTDTLILKQPCERLQVRLTLGGDAGKQPKLKLLGLAMTDSKSKPDTLEPNKQAWGKTIQVPEKSQMAYPNGGVLCSPTTVSMLLGYWSRTLKQPDLDHDVPDVVKGVYDEKWHGTGNWPFNTAYAGSLQGMRGYVSRFSDVCELEDWIAAGLPVGLSLDYDRLRGKGPGPNGHLVVCVGFTPEGDVILNDPGTFRNVRKTFPRKSLVYAWAYSKNTVYLIYPENAALPQDRFGHWTIAR